MTMTRKQAAQRLLDSFQSEKRMKLRIIFAISQAIIISAIITFFTSWYFGLAALLVMGLLIQFAFERMKNSITASKLTAIKGLRWDEESLEKEDIEESLQSIISKGEKYGK
jgi:c-di-AMP phosphodiesterase-like protein